MNEEAEVKAPVTRLRRRLSVEQSEDGKSSPALGTPTKKRGGRKAAKPELDLIEENEAENNLKKTMKKTAKDIAELESEKPVTPSRRSARIKSNTSIVSDSVQNVDSPRAKRAARRISQVGSDTEMSLTPARTRRTRKDSSSSVEKQVISTPTTTKTVIPEVITEEPENSTKSTKDGSKPSDNESTTQTPIRQSPRLVKKKSRNSNSSTQDEARNDSVESNNGLIKTTESDMNDAVKSDIKTESHTNIIKEKDNTNSNKNRLSISSSNLISNLEDKPKKNHSSNNKSLCEAHDSNKIKSKRHRTKSWTTLTNDSSIKEDFFSDNEIVKKKYQQKLGDSLKKKTFNSGSGDNMDIHDSNIEELNSSQNKILSSSKKKKRESISEKSVKESVVTNLFQKDPSENIQTTIVIEDSDSNSLQVNLSKNNINEDQCVPVIDHELENKGNESPEFTLSASFNKNKNESVPSKLINTNNTCEPMDVDETLPECLPNLSNKAFENQEKSLLHNTLEINSSMMNKTSNRSNRKSSTNLSTSQNLEKSNTENKSTLVLSQLKDMSNSENKSPKLSKKEQLLQSSNLLNITQENENRKKISLTYLTSTPLQNKVDLGDNGKNKSNNIFDTNISKNKDNITPKKNVSQISDRSAEQTSEAESESDEDLETSKTSNLLDNEAEDANDDYESGDSQDEDERQYEKDNEIVEKGETLTSEDELSDDSEYEKDSFVVTSDEEDNELLSGSGDDLSMSDNELKMNPKSKKKYNDKKLKEQKQASREMYESRHKLNTSKKDHSSTSSKKGEKSRARLDSSNSDNSEDNIKFTKKNKRMRLDSTAIDSINISTIENRDSSKKDMDLSVSSSENILKEKEITINEVITENKNDPLALTIKEENISMKESNVSIDFVDADEEKGSISKRNTPNSKSLQSKIPLEDSDNSSSSLSTEDENIAQNYNDMLSGLKVKTANHSLNIEKKSKKKSSTPIVDQLNITQTKALQTRNKSSQKENSTTNLKVQKKNIDENWSVTNYVNQEPDQNSIDSDETVSVTENKNLKFGDCSLNLENKSQKKSKPSLVDQLNLTQGNVKKSKKNEKRKSKNSNTNDNVTNDDSSDSIDLKLLFSEDSINSSDLNKENVKKAGNDTDNFIPLKKSEAKTDVRATKDLVDNDNAEPPFFVDTIGNQLSNSSGNKEILIKKNVHKETHKEGSCDDDSNEEPLEISYKKEQNEKFLKKNKEENIEVDETDHGTQPQREKKLNKSITKEDKKKNTSASFNVSNLDVLFSVENIMESSNYKTGNKTPGSEKKKMKKLLEPNESDVCLKNSEVAHNKSISKTPKSERKKKKLSMSENSETFNLVDEVSDEVLDEQNSISESIAKTPSSEKKKTNKLLEPNESDVELKNSEVKLNKSISKTPKSEKKKKKLSVSENLETFSLVEQISDEKTIQQNSTGKSIAKTPSSEKKKTNKLLEPNEPDVELKNSEVKLNKSISKTPKSEKKKKKLSVSENSETFSLVEQISDEKTIQQNSTGKSITKTPGSEKKKTSELLELNDADVEVKNGEVKLNKSISKTPKSEKKEKKLSVSKTSETFNLIDTISDEVLNKQNSIIEPIAKTPNSEKKKMGKLSQRNISDVELNNTEIALNKSIGKTPNSEKKKKNLLESENSESLNLIDKLSNKSENKPSINVELEIEANQNKTDQTTDGTLASDGDIANSKKRKRSSVHLHDAASEGDLSKINVPENYLIVSNKKKRKISQKSEENDAKDILNPDKSTENNVALNTKVNKTKNSDVQPIMSQSTVTDKKSKKSYEPTPGDLEKSKSNQRNAKVVKNMKHKEGKESGNLKPTVDKNKKRKNRDDDNDTNEAIKIRKENSFDHIHISRLPTSILNKLDDKPNKVKVATKKQNVISTTEFEVEVTRQRRTKPSNYLEESIYLNDDESMEEKKKAIITKPKVLPFVPTAITSNSGYTTNFKVNVIPQEIKFVAQSNNVNSFKNEYLYGKKIKRLGTYDLYKKNRNIKMSKF